MKDPARTIVICEEITYESTKNFLEQLAVLDAEPGPIVVQVCSPGGTTTDGMAIFDAIQNAHNHVVTVGLGEVGSIATLIFSAGHQRLIGRNCTMFLHETSVHLEANITELRSIQGETERLHNRYVLLLAKRSGLALEVMDKLTRKDTYLSAEKVCSLGLADGYLDEYSTKKKLKLVKAKKVKLRSW